MSATSIRLSATIAMLAAGAALLAPLLAQLPH
jgi:hypothetical protein